MTYSWVILEADKLVTNMEGINFKPLKGFKDDQLRILRYPDHDSAYHSLLSENGTAFKAKNKNKDCSYTIIKVYE